MSHLDAVIEEIRAERSRQITAPGIEPGIEREFEADTLATGAAFYALPPETTDWAKLLGIDLWPFEGEPNRKSRRYDLIRAAAMILAEIGTIDGALDEDGQVSQVPTPEDILVDPSSPIWIKHALGVSLQTDPVDAASAAEILYRCLDARCRKAVFLPGADHSGVNAR